MPPAGEPTIRFDSERSPLRIVAVAIALSVLCLLFAPPVSAHAYLDGSTPENGEQLTSTPEEIELTYTGDGIQTADVTVTGPEGTELGGDPILDPDERRQLRVPIEDGGEGMYIVEWRVLADDGHTTSGTFFFSVGDDPVDREAVITSFEDDTDEELSWLEAVSKGAMLIAVVGLLGVPLSSAFALTPLRRRAHSASEMAVGSAARDRETELYHDVRRAVTTLCSALLIVLFVSVLLFGIASLRSLGGVSEATASRFLGTLIGQIWVLKTAIAIAGLGVLTVALGTGSRRQLLVGATAVGGSVAVLIGVTSHSATAISPLVGSVVDGLHIVGAAAWVGGLAVFAAFLSHVRELDDVGRRISLTNAVVRRYSVFALAGAILSVSTGLMLAAWHVGTVDGLSETLYGTVLTVKLLFISIAIALGGYHRLVVVPRMDPSSASLFNRLQRDDGEPVTDGGSASSIARFETTVRIELVALVCVLVLSGVLTSAATAAVVTGSDNGLEHATIETTFDDGTDVLITAHSRAVETHGSEFMFEENELVVFDIEFERGGESVESDGPVELLATTPEGTLIERELEPSGETRYSAVQTLPDFGHWKLRISGSPEGDFGSAWIDAFVVPSHDIDDPAVPSGAENGDPFGSSLFLSGVVVGVGGLLLTAREARKLSATSVEE